MAVFCLLAGHAVAQPRLPIPDDVTLDDRVTGYLGVSSKTSFTMQEVLDLQVLVERVSRGGYFAREETFLNETRESAKWGIDYCARPVYLRANNNLNTLKTSLEAELRTRTHEHSRISSEFHRLDAIISDRLGRGSLLDFGEDRPTSARARDQEANMRNYALGRDNRERGCPNRVRNPVSVSQTIGNVINYFVHFEDLQAGSEMVRPALELYRIMLNYERIILPSLRSRIADVEASIAHFEQQADAAGTCNYAQCIAPEQAARVRERSRAAREARIREGMEREEKLRTSRLRYLEGGVGYQP
ncbi:MAG: hypothetical protein KTR14_08245 [Vampirovibrio sp.]|nr:hypothetical protein [Vampirovibrio sp.]